MGHQFGRERAGKRVEEQRQAGHNAHLRQTEVASPISGDGLTRAQRSMLMAQQTIGNQAVLRRLAVQRQDDDGGAPGDIGGGGDSQSLSAGGSNVTVDASGVTITGGIVNIDAPMVRAAGVLQSDTLITNSVVSSSYTPGAGNIW